MHKVAAAVQSNTNLHDSASEFRTNVLGDAIDVMGEIATNIDVVIPDKKPSYVIENAFYLTYLGNVINNIKVGEISKLNELEAQYREGIITIEEYKNILDEYK